MSATQTVQDSAIPAPITSAVADDSQNVSIYVLPELLTANETNEKARPGEDKARRAARVLRMAASIKAGRQNQPVLVTEISDDSGIHYEYIDGGSRVEAIALINAERAALPKPLLPMNVWCSIVPGDSDFFQTAVVSNLVREDNSILEIAAIVRETEERNGWAGKRGANRKIADYLSMPESRVSEFKKINDKATPKLKAMMASGEITSVDAAIKLVGLPDDKIESVADRALEIAKEREAEKANAVAKVENAGGELVPGEVVMTGISGPIPDGAVLTSASSDPAVAANVSTSDVRQAASEQGESVGPLNKKDILEFFAEKTGPAYSDEIKKFCEYFVDSYAKGLGTDRTANKLFDVMTKQSAETKAANKQAAKDAAVAAALEAKAAADKAKKRGPKSK